MIVVPVPYNRYPAAERWLEDRGYEVRSTKLRDPGDEILFPRAVWRGNGEGDIDSDEYWTQYFEFTDAKLAMLFKLIWAG